MIKNKKILLIFFAVFILANTFCFAQDRDEREEKFLKMQRLRAPRPTFKLNASAQVSAGYDSNVNLTPESKGDIFEEFLFSANVAKRLGKDFKLIFYYNLGALNYNEVTSASNILNHFYLELSKKVSKFNLGTGYDLGILSYMHDRNDTESGDFAFHKFFLYARQPVTPRIYHQLLVEYGIKDYFDRKAMGDTINTYQDKERLDRRQTVEYSIGYLPRSWAFFKIKGGFSVNKSNDRYEDYYDYKTYTVSPSAGFQLTPALSALINFAYTWKDYDSRLVLNETYKEDENLFYASLELRYKLRKNDILRIGYTYRNNETNAPSDKYNENLFSCGLQHNF